MGEHLHEAKRTLGDQHRLARIATFLVAQQLNTGDYDEALRSGGEALSIERSLGDLPRATRVLERSHDLCRTWKIVVGMPVVAAALGTAYVLTGRADEALPLIARAVDEFRGRQLHRWPGVILLCAGMTYLQTARITEAAGHAREALALTRRLGARASEAHALCFAGDVALTAGDKDAEAHYREAPVLAGELGMCALVAHCHPGLGKHYRCVGRREQAREHFTTAAVLYREMDMRFWLEQAENATTELA